MNRQETRDLWHRCEAARAAALEAGKSYEFAHECAKTIWADWAIPLLNKRKLLLSSGLFKMNKEHEPPYVVSWKKPANEQTQQFENLSFVDFEEYEFEDSADFRGFVFPGDAWFGRKTIFLRGVEGGPAIFKKNARFSDAIFHGDARFDWINFQKVAHFSRTRFMSDAGFDQVKFNGPLWFTAALFKSEVWFGQVEFNNWVDFSKTEFSGVVAFNGATAKAAFIVDECKFTTAVPNFIQTDFNQAPHFNNVRLPRATFWSRVQPSDAPKYRAIRRLAIEGHDHENEARAFKGEIRAKRGTEHRWWQATFWFGILYDMLSDFGQSIMRPFLAWLISLPIFAVIYLIHSNKFIDLAARCTDGTSPLLKSVLFSLKNSVLFINWDREHIRAAYICLYDQAPGQSELIIPETSAFIQAVQSLWSVLIIFLFLLAVRNHFRIR